MKKLLLSLSLLVMALTSNAQNNSNRIMIGVGALYERGFDVTLSAEHESLHHNAWEYFLNGYIKYAKDETAGHITHNSFWKNYRTWGGGIAYKPCVVRAKNSFGSLRLGGSIGSDTKDFVGWVNVGYEQNYALRGGWKIFWQVKSDFCINGQDLFRTGIVLGVKMPTGAR